MDSHKYDENVELLDPSIRVPYSNMKTWSFDPEYHAQMRLGTIFAAPPKPDNVNKEEISNVATKGYLYSPTTLKEKNPAILYLHGGGYIVGHPEMLQGAGYLYAAQSGAIVFAPFYRLSPEHSHPAQLEDAISALKWLAAMPDVDTSRIVVAGVSAGGGLAGLLTIAVREDASLPRVSGLLLDIPYLGPVPTNPSTNPSFEKVWSRESLALSVNWFSDGKPNDKTAFPLLATSLADFPPTIIGAAEYDILRDQAIQFATRLWNESRAGCEIHVWKGTIHAGASLAPQAQIHQDQRRAYVCFLENLWASDKHS